MIYLNVQLKLLIFSFIFGFFLGTVLDKYNIYIKNKKTAYIIVLTFLMMLVFSLIYFISIMLISNAMFHIYSLLCIILGILVYKLIIKKIT